MENPAFNPDAIELPPPTDVSPTPKNNTETFQPQSPIILNPGVSQEIPRGSKRGLLSTFGLLLAGWFVGNLVILAAVAALAIGTVGSAGLVKVPILTSYLFGAEQPHYTPAESFDLDDANLKLAEVNSLAEGQSLKNLELSEAEINALLNNEITHASNFPIANQKLVLTNGHFIFTGNLVATNAPVEIVGNLQVDSLSARVTLTAAKFGKIKIPLFLASNIVDSGLSKIGLSLSGSSIPAGAISILDGKLVLKDVVNQSN